MKSKILLVVFAVLFSGVLSACSEDEIAPTDKKPVARGVVLDDPGF